MGIMNFTKKPNKRMRLDLLNNHDTNVGHEDLWGQEDITAEEFDMLEVQATQETTDDSSFRPPLPKIPRTDTSLQVDIAKQEQYELEGKVKILSDSLETLKKDLMEEKIKKDKIISEKVQEYQQKEKMLKKEIEKAQSSLQFKDQEIKSVYAKVKVLEMQLKESTVKDNAPSHKSPNKFLEKFNFKVDVSAHTSELQHPQQPSSLCRKYKLHIDTPQGKTTGCDIVSTILCNQLSSPISSRSMSSPLQTEMEVYSQNSHLTAMSVTKLSLEQKTEDIFHHSFSVLKSHLSHLHSLSIKAAANSKSPISARQMDLICDKSTILSCMKDLSYIISCPQFSNVISNLSTERIFFLENKMISTQNKGSESIPTNSMSICDKKDVVNRRDISLLKLLFKLTNPENYPEGYSKSEEINWSLSIIVSWSEVDFKSILDAFDEQVILSHINRCYCITSTLITLKLLLNMCTHKEYLSKLFHKENSCHMCSIAMLLHHKISNSLLDCINLMLLVENFLSMVFKIHTFSDMKFDRSPCSVMVLQAFMSSLWKFYKIRKESSSVTPVLKKGFTLLHYLSKYTLNFKERRIDFEDIYISLVCGMLILSKEDPLFKDFYELAHELWDFQEDTSEFDVEDTQDDLVQSTSVTNQNES